MADAKISALTNLTAADAINDMIPIVDVSDTPPASGNTKRISINNLLSSSPTASGALTVTGLVTAGSATITGDLTVRTNKLLVTATGVGVGASPVNAFDVVSTSGTLAVFKRTGSNGAFIGLEDGSGSGLAYLGVTSGTFAIQTPGSGYSDKYTIASDGTATWSVAGTTAMTLNSTGLAIGVTPNTWTLYKALQVNSASIWSTTGNDTTYASNVYYDGAYKFRSASSEKACMYTQFGGQHLFYYTAAAGTAGNTATFTQAMTLDASGNLLVKKTAISSTTLGCELTATGQINGATANLDNLNIYNTTASAYRFFVSAAGTVNATNATITAISDARLKENVQDIDVGLNAILALKPRKFDWKAGKGKDIKGDRGFIAQEFETVFPNLVDEWKDPAPEGEAPYKSVRQDLIPVLVKAIQELTARVQTLEAR
jgi:hypothetical protein